MDYNRSENFRRFGPLVGPILLGLSIAALGFVSGCSEHAGSVKMKSLEKDPVFVAVPHEGVRETNIGIEAISSGDLNQVKELLGSSIIVGNEMQDGLIPLTYAISLNQVEVAKFLIDSGAELESHLVIHEAAKSKEMYDLLAQSFGANLLDPIIFSLNFLTETEAISVLAEGFDSLSDDERIALMTVAITLEKSFFVQALIDKGAIDLNGYNQNGLTPLHVAVYAASADIVGRLLGAGALPTVASMSGVTAFQAALALGLADKLSLTAQQ